MALVNSYQEDDTSKLAGELFSGKLGVEEALAKLRTRLLDGAYHYWNLGRQVDGLHHAHVP